ncbi:MAG: Mov34/MPN/PAD-1 family protein [Nostoc sp.]|uniref:Mov34/MPN/PAD-1 family protein n=1 Tax=Nostoc sp. TaxID=1180 RepID=UPI002FF897D7
MIYNLRKIRAVLRSRFSKGIAINNTDFPKLSEPNHLIEQNERLLAQLNHIEWVECEDVYKPTEKRIQEFITERDISSLEFNQVYILREALTALCQHLEKDVSVEHGGILFGQAYIDPEHGIYVEITAAVAAPATIGTGAHLEFTPESWLQIMDYARAVHPETNIVGWYHSHPSIGVFMSGTDMRTQRAFFPHPWCLSIVCDPIRREIGYFLGEQAKRLIPVKFN